MLVFGTQMHIITYIFVCVETVILFYLVIYWLARPNDKTAILNITLIFLLLLYNIAGGLLPDPKLPGSFFIQENIAYATGFITPCFFPYYVYKAFDLKKMRFHAYKGIYLFLILPYFIFVVAFYESGSLSYAQYFLILPVLYATWILYSLIKAIQFKYRNDFSKHESRAEIAVMLISLVPWIGLPFITFFNFGQATEAIITNAGFLLLWALQVERHVRQTRTEHQVLIDTELKLLEWNKNLQKEVDKRTIELKKMNEQKTNTFVNLVHETKTPLCLLNNYLEEYIKKYGAAEELNIIKGSVNKLTRDINSLFDIEKFTKGLKVFNHSQITNFSEVLKSRFALFEYYSQKQLVSCHQEIDDNVFIKADPAAINRIVNNLIENAIKFSFAHGKITIRLKTIDDKIHFLVQDSGMGIPMDMQKKIFEPYYQINHPKASLQGMGLGLPIVKKATDSIGATIHVESNPAIKPGTKISIIFNNHQLAKDEVVKSFTSKNIFPSIPYKFEIMDSIYNPNRQSILLIEDNNAMLNFLFKRLSNHFNVFCALNGSAALRRLRELSNPPDIIVSDIMMDKMDGFAFAKALSGQDSYAHIPLLFLSAKSSVADKLKGLQLGAIDLMQKPFSFEELHQKINTLLIHFQKQKRAILNSISNLNVSQNSILAEDKMGSSKFEQKCKLYNLTRREVEIVKLIINGFQYKRIAKTLFISEGTVNKHIQNIFVKTEASNKVQLLNKMQA